MFGEASQLDLTFPLESAHGFGQESGASELRRNPHYTTKASGRNFQMLQGGLCFNLYFIKFVSQNLINQMNASQFDRKLFRSMVVSIDKSRFDRRQVSVRSKFELVALRP